MGKVPEVHHLFATIAERLEWSKRSLTSPQSDFYNFAFARNRAVALLRYTARKAKLCLDQ